MGTGNLLLTYVVAASSRAAHWAMLNPLYRVQGMSDKAILDGRRRTDVIVRAAFARIDILALAIAAGAVGAFVLFLATAWLLLRGAPPGVQVGAHLGLLAHFLPGYSVSWGGSMVGLMYGFLIGFCCSAVVGTFWNLIHYAYLLTLSRADAVDRTEL
jgi:hypothetical protein